jgi:ABC-type transport system substrate-binding protein
MTQEKTERILAVLVLSFCLLNLMALNGTKAQQIPQGGTLHIALPYQVPTTFNPFYWASIYEGAPHFDNLQFPYGNAISPTGEASPFFVDNYWAENNYTTWYFHIRPAQWSDGSPATAYDLGLTLNISIQTPDLTVETPEFSVPTSVHVENASLLKVVLPESNPGWGPQMVSPWWYNIVPSSAYAKPFNDPNFFDWGPTLNTVSYGPFYAYNYTQGDPVTKFLRNPYYNYSTGHPAYLDGMDITWVTTSSSVTLGLLTGQFDVGLIDPSQVPAIAKQPGLSYKAENGMQLAFLLYNTTTYPYNIPEFRQALAYAIDRNALVQQVLSGFGTAGNPGFMSPEATAFYNPNVPQYPFNQTMAKQLLQKAGFTLGSDGFWDYPNGQRFTATIMVNSQLVPNVLAASLIVDQLRQIGLDVSSLPETQPAMSSQIKHGFDASHMALITKLIWYNMPAYLSWQWYSIGWISFKEPYKMLPPEADAEYAQQFNILQRSYPNDLTAAKNAAFTLQDLIATNLPAICLYYPAAIVAYDNRFQGWPTDPDSHIYLGYQADFNLTVLDTLYLSTSSTASALTTVMTTSVTSAAPSGVSSMLYLGVAVVILVVAAGAYAITRRRGPSSKK